MKGKKTSQLKVLMSSFRKCLSQLLILLFARSESSSRIFVSLFHYFLRQTLLTCADSILNISIPLLRLLVPQFFTQQIASVIFKFLYKGHIIRIINFIVNRYCHASFLNQ